jgi:phage terminase small subunit
MNTSNPKHTRFAEATLNGHTAKDAAIMAGYSKATATTAGCRLLKHPGVKAELVRMSAERRQRAPVFTDPLDFLRSVANSTTTATQLRVRAAKALLLYMD